MFFQHVYDKTLAQGSYLIGCQESGEAIVIDAKRDIDIYLQLAEENNLHITHLAETHIHADFLCGTRELSFATGAKMYLSDEGGNDWQYEFDHEGLKHGDVIRFGNLSLEAIHTPGHTPESICFLLTDHAAIDEFVMVFTGDFIFVGDVGRPDLLETAAGKKHTKRIGAKQVFQSLKKFKELPDDVQVWPGHGAGSSCGKALGAVPCSTVGYEKKQNWALQFGTDEDGFVEKLLDGQPEPPKYFAMMKHLNKVERPLRVEIPCPAQLSKAQFLTAYRKGIKVIDTRSADLFAFNRVPNSINIQNTDSFATWMGWQMDYQEQFILIAAEDEMEDLTRKLMRIGLDNSYGYFPNIGDLFFELSEGGGSMDTLETEDFKKYLAEEKDIRMVDVRGASEFKSGHIEGAKHLFVGAMEENIDALDKEQPTVVYCKSGMRSSIAYSILKKNGFHNVKNYWRGIDGWKADGGDVI